ncbi:MAG: TIM barrel protein [Nanoarchaeota archaeon]
MADIFKREYAGSMDSKYYFTSDKLRAGLIGATASPQTPNQIGELTSRLNQGLKAVEIGAMNQRLLDQVPLKHFTEMKRLNKLTGAEATLHAPIQDLDLAGFTQQGWNDFERKESVEKLKSVIDRAHLLNDKGNVPITVHAGGFPAMKWQKEGLHKGGEVEEGAKSIQDQRSEMIIVNQDTGQLQSVRYREKEYISGKKVAWTPEYSMQNLNRTSWDDEKLRIMQWKKEMNEVQDRFNRLDKQRLDLLKKAEGKKLLTGDERMELARLNAEEEKVNNYRDETYTHIRSLTEDMYNRYRKYKIEGSEVEKKQHEHLFKEVLSRVNEDEEKAKRIRSELSKISERYKEAKTESEVRDILDDRKVLIEKHDEITYNQSEAIARGIEQLPAPKTWVPVDDFAKEKVSSSITEAALYAYKKYGEKAPIISMENVYPEFPLSRAESLKGTIEEAKKKFREELTKDKKLNISEKKAEEIANKIIGVTWDVGHIYMLKKYGYSDEDIRKEAKKIGEHVTHLHLTDNFGFEDSHLPPGEGAVNIKEQLKEIESSMSDEKKKNIKAIVEAGEFVANFKEVPHLYALSHLESPLYSENLGPTWQDIWETQGHYMSGFGEIMPQKYFDLYGAPGFSQLPSSLGGSAGSPERGRFAASQQEET